VKGIGEIIAAITLEGRDQAKIRCMKKSGSGHVFKIVLTAFTEQV